ncbi:MAG: GyrI-like domain-containing protein [Planctomycetota bacterium]|nr:GyrI-like domain-containing protein [Planctomycetota bacterium]
MKNHVVLAFAVLTMLLGFFTAGCDKGEKESPKIAEPSEIEEYSGCTIKSFPKQTLIVFRCFDTMANLSSNFGELFQWFVITQTEIHGPNTAIFFTTPTRFERKDDQNKLMYYVGIPVADDTIGSGKGKRLELDSTRAACTLHRGSYTQINDSYARLLKWMNSEGLESKGLFREVYIRGPGPNDPGLPSKWITEVRIPIK